MTSGKMGEKHEHSLPLGLLGLVRKREHDSFFFPLSDAIGLAVGQ